MNMKNRELVLLFSEDESHLVEVSNRVFHTRSGIIELKELKKKRYGDKVKTHLGKEFVLIKPNILDVLEKKLKRLPQIIVPNDIGMMIAYTGIQPGSLIVDAGTGSGFLAILLANCVRPGKVVTYENEKRFFKVAKENVNISGLGKFIELKKKDVTKGIYEKNVDVVTLDMKDAKKVVKHAYKALRLGGWLVVYSPYVDQVKELVGEMKRRKFSEIKVIENISREWQVEKGVRPKTVGLTHTEFLTFARKLN
jgi:tRNA (adenine57-N1/adenine58-N1)-methyltransferase